MPKSSLSGSVQLAANHQSPENFSAIFFSLFWLKSFGTAGFTFLFLVAYIAILKHPVYTVSVMPITWLDNVIRFEPMALPVYLSLWPYVSIPPVLMASRRSIFQYGWKIGALCLIGLGLFYFFPSAVPPANIDWAIYPGMAFLKGVDASGNACPSLHVATAVFSAVWLHYRIRRLGFGSVWIVANIVWCSAIVYSTMATKQHVAIDVYAGTLLALVCAWVLGLKKHAEQ